MNHPARQSSWASLSLPGARRLTQRWIRRSPSASLRSTSAPAALARCGGSRSRLIATLGWRAWGNTGGALLGAYRQRRSLRRMWLVSSRRAHRCDRAAVLARSALPRYCASMKLAQSRVTAQGQISVPAEVRKRLELVPGSILEWDAEGDRITVRRVGRHTFEDLHRALFSQEPQPRSLEDLKEGIRQHMRARHARR